MFKIFFPVPLGATRPTSIEGVRTLTNGRLELCYLVQLLAMTTLFQILRQQLHVVALEFVLLLQFAPPTHSYTCDATVTYTNSDLTAAVCTSFSQTISICLPKRTDGTTPQTVQGSLACFKCRSHIGLEFFGRLSV